MTQCSAQRSVQVAFGTATQLVLEGRPHEELDTVFKFCLSVGLPVTLGQVGAATPCAEVCTTSATACTASMRACRNVDCLYLDRADGGRDDLPG